MEMHYALFVSTIYEPRWTYAKRLQLVCDRKDFLNHCCFFIS